MFSRWLCYFLYAVYPRFAITPLLWPVESSAPLRSLPLLCSLQMKICAQRKFSRPVSLTSNFDFYFFYRLTAKVLNTSKLAANQVFNAKSERKERASKRERERINKDKRRLLPPLLPTYYCIGSLWKHCHYHSYPHFNLFVLPSTTILLYPISEISLMDVLTITR